MLQIPRNTLMILIITVVAITMIGTMIGAFVAFVPAPSNNTSDGPAGGDKKVPAAQDTPTAPQPTPTPADPRSTTINGVSLTLADIRKSTEPKGVEVTVEIANQTKGNVSFAFFPARDISLSDNVGSNYSFQWAEYAGDVKVESGQKVRLVRAFFAGPDRDINPDTLRLSVGGVPQISKATWEITWPSTSTKPTQISVATPAPTPDADKPTNGVGAMITQNKISLTLVGADFNSELGGLIVTMAILNNTAGDISFPFSPERNVAIVDNRGSAFNLRWAEYPGIVTVSRGQQVQMVKAFYEGPVSDALTNSLTISVSDIPDFGKAAWQVPIRR